MIPVMDYAFSRSTWVMLASTQRPDTVKLPEKNIRCGTTLSGKRVKPDTTFADILLISNPSGKVER